MMRRKREEKKERKIVQMEKRKEKTILNKLMHKQLINKQIINKQLINKNQTTNKVNTYYEKVSQESKKLKIQQPPSPYSHE